MDLNVYDLEDIEESLGIYLMNGGQYNCDNDEKRTTRKEDVENNKKNESDTKNKTVEFPNVAIIVPYRNRLTNLKIFLNNMHPYLMRQNLNYGIYLVEPIDGLEFNRGILMNIGFVESLRDTMGKWPCFIFHDIDMLPENAFNFYTCNHLKPIQYAIAVSEWEYK